MKIDCYISEGCTSEAVLRVNIVNALKQEGMKAEIQYHKINDSEAKKMGIMGSPTVRINGVDILPGDTPGTSWRVFKDESGRLMPIPSVGMLRNAVRGKINKGGV